MIGIPVDPITGGLSNIISGMGTKKDSMSSLRSQNDNAVNSGVSINVPSAGGTGIKPVHLVLLGAVVLGGGLLMAKGR